MPVYRIPPGYFDLPNGMTLADFPEALRQINNQAAAVALREAQENAWQFRDTGALARAITARVTDLTVIIEVPQNQPASAYAAVYDLAAPEVANFHRAPPAQALVGWVRRQLGVPQDQTLNVAYAVARSIRNRGLPGSTGGSRGPISRRFMGRAFDVLQQQLPGIISQVMGRMGI